MEPTDEERERLAAWAAEQAAQAHPLDEDAARELVDLFAIVQHDSGAA